MQPYFLPYIGYWQLINLVEKFIIFDDVNFMNKSYLNRNKFLVNGKPFQFSLELIGASQNKLINEIQIGNNSSKILKTIEYNYKKAPNFDRAFPLFEDIFCNEEKNLAKFIGYSLKKISVYMNISTDFIYSSEINKNSCMSNQDKIIHICKMCKSTNYINPIGGKQLYSYEYFKKNNIKLNFFKSKLKKYHQFNNDFIPFLSIVDVIMFNELNHLENLINLYELIE